MTLTVRDLMTSQPYTLGPEATLAEVYELMDTHNVRHVPIVDDDQRLQGLVSHRDIVRGALQVEKELPLSEQQGLRSSFSVGEVMTNSPETVDADDEIRVAGELMTENKFGCLPVVDGDKLVGILTETDFVRYVLDSM